MLAIKFYPVIGRIMILWGVHFQGYYLHILNLLVLHSDEGDEGDGYLPKHIIMIFIMQDELHIKKNH